jgi:uncharacterized protein (DUF2267 family)
MMGHDPKDLVDRLTEASVEARSATHDLYAAIKEARRVMRELEDVIGTTVAADVQTVLDATVRDTLANYGDVIKQAMDDAVARVQRQFDRLTNIMMTGSPDGRPDDGYDIRTIIEGSDK